MGMGIGLGSGKVGRPALNFPPTGSADGMAVEGLLLYPHYHPISPQVSDPHPKLGGTRRLHWFAVSKSFISHTQDPVHSGLHPHGSRAGTVS